MLAVTVELLHGTIRAGSPDGLAATGVDDPGEWPPSPARLLSAFVAADGTGVRCRHTTGSELRAIELASPPVILADGSGSYSTTPAATRYVVIDGRSGGAVQGYPGRTSAEVRPARRAAPPHPTVCYVWPTLDVSADETAALRRRAARIGYLGCADSPARVTVSAHVPEGSSVLSTWHPTDTPGGDRVALPVPYDGYIAALDVAYEQFVAGVPVQRSWMPAERSFYTDQPEVVRPHVVWLRLARAISGRRVLAVTQALRRAVLARYREAAGGDEGTEAPDVVAGHGFSGKGYHHAHWLALPDVGHRHARGRIHGLAIWLPPDASPAVAATVRRAASLVAASGLRLPGGEEVEMIVSDGTDGPRAVQAQRWTRPSSCWETVFPAVHEHWGGPLTLGEVSSWCAHALLPTPMSFDAATVPLIPGGVSLRPHETRRPGGDRRPYSHVRLRFADPVEGPVMVGRLRQFGLGLMAPVNGAP